MILAIAVSVAAGLGAVLRYVVDQAVTYRTGGELPYGTLTINITGSLLLGVITGLALHDGLAPTPTLILGIGLAGGYTTLSTWSWESIALAEDGAIFEAGLNIVASFTIGLAAAAAGLAVTQL